MAEGARPQILLYGPRQLGYAAHPLVRPRLDVEVLEPPGFSERTQDPAAAPGRPPQVPPLGFPPEPGEIWYFTDPRIRGREPRRIRFEPEEFSAIENRGLIVVIETASFVPLDTFEAVGERAADLRLPTVPLYVRGLGPTER